MTFRIGFVMKGEEIVQTIRPTSPNDAVVGAGGDLRVTDYDGEVFIFAAGEWTGVKIEKEGSRS